MNDSKSLTLKVANDYINRRSVSREDQENIKNLVYDFKNNFSGFLSLVIYRQISRISRMLDKIEEIEDYLFTQVLVQEGDIESLDKFQKSLNNHTMLLIDQLTGIAANPNMKIFFENNGLFVEKISQKLYQDSGNLNPEMELSSGAISKESRKKIKAVVENVLLHLS